MTTPFRPVVVFLFVLCALVPAAFAAPPADAGGGKSVDGKDRALRVGDALVVSIRDLEGPKKNTLVEVNLNEKGEITLPYLSKGVPAEGLTTEKLRDAIARAYRRDRLIDNATVTVKLGDSAKDDPNRAIRAGDPLVVSIHDLEAPGKNTVVKANVNEKGEVTLPMLSKPVPARGLTRETLRDAIVKAYERDQLIANAVVTVKFRNPEKKEPPVPKE